MRLVAGERAPDCDFVTLRGERVTLSRLRGRPVWLSFSRFAACPLCNFRVHQVIGQWASRFSGSPLRHFMFFQSPASKLAEYVATHDPPFDLVADPELELYRRFRVELSLTKMISLEALKITGAALRERTIVVAGPDGPIHRIPADFLIDPEGVLRVARYGESIVDHVALDEVSAFAARYV